MKFSLITVSYNSAFTLEDTLNSVLSQNYPNIEYLIIDGGSTDGTLEIIKKYEVRFKGKLRWISERDKGLYDAMNKGINMATGDVVGFLNSDDFFSFPNVLSSQMACFTKGVDAVYGDVKYVQRKNPSKLVRYYSSATFKRWKMRMGYMPAHPTFYCRKKVYQRYGNFNLHYRVAADFECLLRLIYVYQIKTIYNPMEIVTMRTGGASNNGLISHWQIMKDHLTAFRENGVYSNIFIISLRYISKVIDLVKGQFNNMIYYK